MYREESMVCGSRKPVFEKLDHTDNYFYLWDLSIFIWKMGDKGKIKHDLHMATQRNKCDPICKNSF